MAPEVGHSRSYDDISSSGESLDVSYDFFEEPYSSVYLKNNMDDPFISSLSIFSPF